MNKSKLTTIFSAVFLMVFLSLDGYAQLRFDKPKSEPPLDNPYTLGVPREKIVEVAREIFNTCAFQIDEELSKAGDGKIISKNIIFTRGVTAKNDLEHLATMPAGEVRNWQQGRVVIEISALPLDGKKSQILITTRIQGKIADALRSNQWIDGQSTGLLEDQIMRGLAGKILGIDLNVKTGDNKRRILNCEF
jgi:hypothetical protein